MREIKPCPFCGGDAIFVKDDENMLLTFYSIYCEYCPAEMRGTYNKPFDRDEEKWKDGFVKKWNTRALSATDSKE